MNKTLQSGDWSERRTDAHGNRIQGFAFDINKNINYYIGVLANQLRNITMLRIRLSRVGKKNKAQFRVTVADARRSPTGRFIEILGHYDPHTKEKVFKQERIEYWISKGAKPSATIHNFLIDAGIIKGDKIAAWRPKKKKGEEKEVEKKVKKPAEEKKEKREEKTEEAKEKTEKKTEEK